MPARLMAALIGGVLITVLASGRVHGQPGPPPPPGLPTVPGVPTGTATAIATVVLPPAEPIIDKADVQHQVRGKWKSTRLVHRGEKVRFALTWTTTSGSAVTLTASFIVSNKKKVIYRSSQRRVSINPSGSSGAFHWDTSFGSKAPTGNITARFTAHTVATVSKSVTFRLSK